MVGMGALSWLFAAAIVAVGFSFSRSLPPWKRTATRWPSVGFTTVEIWTRRAAEMRDEALRNEVGVLAAGIGGAGWRRCSSGRIRSCSTASLMSGLKQFRHVAGTVGLEVATAIPK